MCRWTNLSRSSLVRLCVPSRSNKFAPPVKSVLFACDGSAAKRGKRGVRMIKLDSLLEHIEAQAEGAPRE